ncbi:MAG: glutamate 5-kinase [Clostridia bacterium]|nr:glutamate 5-kinase [Clostridia bacterium]
MNFFQNIRRLVVKVGTSTLTHDTGKLNLRRMDHLARVLADLRNQGTEIILVSSGAIGVGVGKLKLPAKPHDIGGRQACAAVGQCELMSISDKLVGDYGTTPAQVLLTRDCVDDKMRLYNIQNAFERLLDMGALPIINENDTVATEEIEFGDNDTLSAVVAKVVHADALVILTDIDGLHAQNPKENPDSPLIHVVDHITDETRRIAGGAGSSRGTGGMYTKILAAGIATAAGITTAIIDGSTPENLYSLLAGEEVGTVFPGEKR